MITDSCSSLGSLEARLLAVDLTLLQRIRILVYTQEFKVSRRRPAYITPVNPEVKSTDRPGMTCGAETTSGGCMRNFSLGGWSLLLVLACVAQRAHAQDYPQKPVRFIVGFSPGGGSDILARLLSEKLAESWGRPFVVDNRSGAGGTIALTLAASAAPDGYTLLMISGSQITNAVLMTRLPLD